MNLVQVRVSNPDDLLAVGAYGSGALVRVEASSDGISYAEIGTVTIVSGDTLYTVNHQAGTTSTWYRLRYSNSANTLQSEYSPPFQVKRGWTDIGRVKNLLKIPPTSTTDDDRIKDAVAAANSWLDGEIGMFLGPSADTVRTFDVPVGTSEIYIPGGVRSITTLEYATETGGAFTTIAASDYVTLPYSVNRLPGMVGDTIKLTGAGTATSFYRGYGVVRITGTFGPAEPPASLVRIADTMAVWLYQSQQTGFGGSIGTPELAELTVNRVLTPLDFRTIKMYRQSLRSWRMV